MNFEGHVSVRTDNRRLNEPHKATHKMVAPVITSLAGLLELVTNHLRWNIRNWKRVHWLDESRFLLRPVDGHVRVWWYRNTAFHDGNVISTIVFSVRWRRCNCLEYFFNLYVRFTCLWRKRGGYILPTE